MAFGEDFFAAGFAVVEDFLALEGVDWLDLEEVFVELLVLAVEEVVGFLVMVLAVLARDVGLEEEALAKLASADFRLAAVFLERRFFFTALSYSD